MDKIGASGTGWVLWRALVRYYDSPGSVTKIQPVLGRAKMLGVVERHIAAAGELLTPLERRRIRALRYTSLGRTAYAEGDLTHGVQFLTRAISLGHEPWGNLLYLLVASPPAQFLKRLIRRKSLEGKCGLTQITLGSKAPWQSKTLSTPGPRPLRKTAPLIDTPRRLIRSPTPCGTRRTRTGRQGRY